MYLPILHLPRVELHCKLQEKLHRVSGPLISPGKVLDLMKKRCFKREGTREIVHASCLNVDGSIYILNKEQILEISS